MPLPQGGVTEHHLRGAGLEWAPGEFGWVGRVPEAVRNLVGMNQPKFLDKIEVKKSKAAERTN